MRLRNVLATASIIGALYCMTSAAGAHSSSAQDFVKEAAVANEFEIESSQTALDKSTNSDVKTFAQKMIDDHSQAGKTLGDVVKTNNVQAEIPTSLDDKHKKLLDTLQHSSNDDFDKEYAKMQLKAHKQAVSLFSDYAKQGENDALKTFAKSTLPTLKEHLKMADDLKSHH